jgi:hypothetical protein
LIEKKNEQLCEFQQKFESKKNCISPVFALARGYGG